MTELALPKPHVLPPKGLLLALAGQLPLFLATPVALPSPAHIAGGSLLLLTGVALNVWAERIFRRNGVGVCPFSHVPAVMTHGPYRVTRNPMYLGLVCVNLGVTVLSGVVANAWSSIALAIWLHYAFVLREEAFLRHELGERFDGYARRVPRWLPLGFLRGR
jgi:protein-S-isoprenylcysteine O-methyltransferase Ste14